MGQLLNKTTFKSAKEGLFAGSFGEVGGVGGKDRGQEILTGLPEL